MTAETYTPAPVEKVAGFMAGLALASKQIRLAEMAILELLGWCALTHKDRTEKVVWS